MPLGHYWFKFLSQYWVNFIYDEDINNYEDH